VLPSRIHQPGVHRFTARVSYTLYSRQPVLYRSIAAALLLSATLLQAQQPTPGYSPAAAAKQRAAEADAIRRPTAEQAASHARELSREPHVGGTGGEARTRDYVVQQMRSWGIPTAVREYEVWMPHPTRVGVWRVAPEPVELNLQEPPVAGDPTSALPQYPPVNGYSGSGDATGEVVYVNYGLVEDYAKLDSLGVSVKGKIAIARYGRSFRGIKAREAEKHGAVALLMYSDPEDDGYVRGDVYPEGPMRPEHGIQRGSVMNGAGDPSTPGYPSTRGAKRIPLEQMPVPRIPVVPLSYANAAELLRGIRGTAIPQEWQGGLPFRYHIGPGPVVARVLVENDTATAPFKRIWNTLGTIRGTEFPDEIVTIGAHRDAWGAGAADNVSGTVSVLEAARTIAELAKAGIRPKRTLVFATWDAEEWGLIGSTEHVEQDSLRLQRGGVAYLNQDGTAGGPFFGGGGSPSLRETLRDITRAVPNPDGTGSVYEAWRKNAGVVDSMQPPMGDPGGGSDFAGFYNHLGIPHSDWGFGGASGVYHSAYDTHHWMSRFGDPGYKRHATAAQIGAAMLLRIANAEILPYDYVEFARTMQRYLPEIEAGAQAQGWQLSSEPLRAAIQRMEAAATEFADARDAALVGRALSRAVRQRTNRALLGVERALIRPEGLRTRPWYRNLIYVADENNGYSNMVFPSVKEATRAGDQALAEQELTDLAARFDAATQALIDAQNALQRAR
jgi:N-acetylated-alpha-linked acidic dipeptidase